ncbi:MAG: hypothetical protein M1565_06225 [Actinobacteria bacterium]|nr:hypothetical protein [Actinomycetota bacterium]
MRRVLGYEEQLTDRWSACGNLDLKRASLGAQENPLPSFSSRLLEVKLASSEAFLEPEPISAI